MACQIADSWSRSSATVPEQMPAEQQQQQTCRGDHKLTAMKTAIHNRLQSLRHFCSVSSTIGMIARTADMSNASMVFTLSATTAARQDS